MDYPAYFLNKGIGATGYTKLPNYKTSSESNGALTISFFSTDTNTQKPDIINEYY